MKANEKFSLGDRVRATRASFANGCFINSPGAKLGNVFGTVVGFGRDGYHVKVLRDGQKTPANWSPNFWAVTSKSSGDSCA